MTERRPSSPDDALAPKALTWETDTIRKALTSSTDRDVFALPSPTLDHDEPGLGLVLGDPPHAVVELYPDHQRLHLHLPGLRLDLDGVEAPTIRPEGVIFEHTTPTHALWLSLGRNGEFALQSTPIAPVVAEAPQIVATPTDLTDRAISSLNTEPTVVDHSAALDEPSDTPSPTPQRESGAEQQERIKVFGRLATQVRFKTRQNGQLIGEFILAERIDEEQTAFHKVAAFDNLRTNRMIATKLKDQVNAGELGKGKPATVVGYRHEQERTKRDGTTTKETQIYAVAISAR